MFLSNGGVSSLFTVTVLLLYTLLFSFSLDASNHDPNSGQPVPEAKIFKDDELSNMIDPILANDDKNNDGYIDYMEFVQAQANVAARGHEAGAQQPVQP